MAEDQATEGIPSRSGSPAGKRLTPWSPVNIQAMAERVARCHSGLRPAADSVRPGPDMLADCVRFRG